MQKVYPVFHSYSTYSNSTVPYRSYAEKLIVERIIAFCNEPSNNDIHKVRSMLLDELNNPTYGRGRKNIRISEVNAGSHIAGAENLQTLRFGIYGCGRKTVTLSVCTDLTYDVNNDMRIDVSYYPNGYILNKISKKLLRPISELVSNTKPTTI